MGITVNIDPIISEAGVQIGFVYQDITIYRCQKCGHGWRGDKRTAGRLPKECPKCKVLTWQAEKQD